MSVPPAAAHESYCWGLGGGRKGMRHRRKLYGHLAPGSASILGRFSLKLLKANETRRKEEKGVV